MKIAIITGGSRGLGKSAAIHTGKRGVGVIVTYHKQHEDAAHVVAEIENAGGKAAALKLDVTHIASFTDFVGDAQKLLKQKWGQGEIRLSRK